MTQYTQDIDRMGGPGAYAIMGPSWASAAASPFSTYKFYAGEGGIRSPLIISGVPQVRSGQILHSLTHVTDIVPTLLDIAQVASPGPIYHGQQVEPLFGVSLLPLMLGLKDTVRPANTPLGYELSGNAALFKGMLKLTKNLPPVGDGAWHLYDLQSDPGETVDLHERLPREFETMKSDYLSFSQAHGVLPMPEGYNPSKQVMINSILHYWLPTYALHATLVLIGTLTGIGLLLMRRQRQHK
jgi:arylsulfatase/uncharacterized sulfatase